jgi:hypothetical protein
MSCCWYFSGYLEPLGRFLYHVAPALVTVLLGSFIVQRFFLSRTNEAHFIDSLISRLSDLQEDVLEYWNNDRRDSEKKERSNVLEQKIKGGIKGLAADFGYYSRRYSGKSEFIDPLVDLTDACTGGDFESQARKPDTTRYIFVVNAVNKLRSKLLRRKL